MASTLTNGGSGDTLAAFRQKVAFMKNWKPASSPSVRTHEESLEPLFEQVSSSRPLFSPSFSSLVEFYSLSLTHSIQCRRKQCGRVSYVVVVFHRLSWLLQTSTPYSTRIAIVWNYMPSTNKPYRAMPRRPSPRKRPRNAPNINLGNPKQACHNPKPFVCICKKPIDKYAYTEVD